MKLGTAETLSSSDSAEHVVSLLSLLVELLLLLLLIIKEYVDNQFSISY